jgi:hypothetical protein
MMIQSHTTQPPVLTGPTVLLGHGPRHSLLMGPTHPYEMGRRLKEHGKDRDIK